jgi:capsular exopolysaccharide synthesis family protein
VKAQTSRYLAEANYENMLRHPEAAIPNDTPGTASLTSLGSQLSQSKSQEAALESRYGPNYAPLQEQRAQTAELQKSFDEALKKSLNAAAESVEATRKEEESINDHLMSLQAIAKSRTPETVQFEILKAQYVSDQTLYNVLLAALGTGAIQAGLQGQDLNRFTAAEVPGIKAYPVMSVIAMAGAAIGLLMGMLAVSVILLNSDTVETVDQIEQTLPIPILASVPEYKDEIAAMRISEDALPLVTLLAPRSAGTEAYRLLRTAITLMPISQKHRVISLTSGGPGEGKSTTTMNLAVVLATQSKRVLLIDADLRKPTIAQRLRLPPTDQPGLSRYLSDTTVAPEDCIQKVAEVQGLDIFPVQEVPPFPSELLGQGRLEHLLLWARDHYDYVLIDTPPVLLVTDALIIASHCDTLLLVVRVGVAQKRALRRIRQDLAKYPGKQTGIVVNALPIADTYYGGYGNYRKYYGGKGYSDYEYGEKGNAAYGSESGGYLSKPKKK